MEGAGHGRWDRPRYRGLSAADVALWAGLSAPALIAYPFGSGGPRPPWWLLLGIAMLAPAIAARRRHPYLAVLVTAALTLLHGWFLPAYLVLCYQSGRRRAREWPALLLYLAIGVAGVLAGIFLVPRSTALFNVGPLLICGVVPWLVGRYWRQKDDLEQAGWERAAQLEREHRVVAQRARLVERARIAQQMHDQLGHDLTILSLRAAAAEVAPQLDEESRALAGELRAGASAAVERLHDIIGVLRGYESEAGVGGDDEAAAGVGGDDEAAAGVGGDDEAAAGVETIEEIVEGARSSGMRVELVRSDAGSTSSPVATQIVREALTNVAKHAPGAVTTVTVRGSAGRTEVAVVNSAPAGPPAPDRPSSGLGLAGLRRSVAEAGGEFTAGPRQDGFAVEAGLPDRPPRPPSRPARSRRSLVAILGVPLLAVGTVIAVTMAYFSDSTEGTVLAPESYRSLALGSSRAEISSLLPPKQADVTEVAAPPAPAGSQCEYYRVRNGDLLATDFEVYRLCFASGVLVAKDASRAAGR